MRHFITTLFVLLQFIPSIAQKNMPAFPAEDLSIHWEAVQNDYQNKPWSLNAISITNNSSVEFPAVGWKIYFNSARLIVPAAVSGNARIVLMNGDLFSLTPSAGFLSLKPGASVRIEYVAEEPVVNITDGPEGFYLVWDANPEKGFSTGPFTIHPFKPNYKGLITPGIIYDQNKMIRDIPMEQLTKIFPTPVNYKETTGFFTLTAALRINSDDRFIQEKGGLLATLETLLGKKIVTVASGNNIGLEYKEG